MTKSRRQPAHIYLLPPLVARAVARAKSLTLPLSTYFAILLRNYLYAGKPGTIQLSEEKTSPQVRERLPFSVQKALWLDADESAQRLGGTVSLLVEALVEDDLASGRAELVIWPPKK